MKLEITQKGCFVTTKDGQQEVPVGETIDVKGSEIPASLVNKCRIVGNPAKDAKPVTNPAKDQGNE